MAEDGASGLRPLGEFMPAAELSERHAIEIGAGAGDVDLALRGVAFGEVPLMRLLLVLRGVGPPAAEETVLGAMSRRARHSRVIRPFSGLSRILVLRAVKRRAEAST